MMGGPALAISQNNNEQTNGEVRKGVPTKKLNNFLINAGNL